MVAIFVLERDFNCECVFYTIYGSNGIIGMN